MNVEEKHLAFAEAIKNLADMHPTATNRLGRKKAKARAAAIHFASVGAHNSAFAYAIYGGLRKDQLRAIEALIYK